MLDFGGLNWWAILVATAAAFALGALWYGPLFGKAWVAALGKSEDEIQPSPEPFIVSAVAALITCIVVAALMHGLEMTGPAHRHRFRFDHRRRLHRDFHGLGQRILRLGLEAVGHTGRLPRGLLGADGRHHRDLAVAPLPVRE